MTDVDSWSDINMITDPRYLEIDHKQELIADLLEKDNQTALIIQQPWNFQWFTSGGSNQAADGRICAALYVTKDTRVVLTSNADSPWIFETQIPQLGFYVKERNWAEQPELLANDLCRGRRVVSDTGVANTKNIDKEIQKLRLKLTRREQDLARKLGKDLTSCVERSALKFEPGQTELEVAGSLTQRMMAAGIEPMGVRVIGDGQNERYRQSISRPKRIHRFVTVEATGRRNGLCLSVSRIMCHEPPEPILQDAYQSAAVCQTTGMFWSQPNAPLDEVWNRVERIYQKRGNPDEWRLNEQGAIFAQRPCEHQITASSSLQIEAGMLINWTPQIGQAALNDTILITQDGPEWLTKTEHWPLIQVEIRGEILSCPALVKF